MAVSPTITVNAAEVARPWIVRLRYSMAVSMLAVVFIADRLLDIDLPVAGLAIGPAIIIASNLWFQFGARSPQAFFWFLILDALCLTGELLLAGGATNPFTLLYVVYISLAATILTRKQTWILSGLATLCFASLFWKYRPIAALEMHHPSDGTNLHLLGMWISFGFTAIVVAMSSARISELLRQRETALLIIQDELARKDRLASIVTLAAGAAHELGTPLGTIAVVARELERYATMSDLSPVVAEDSRLIRTEVDRCRAILERLSAEGAEPAGEALTRIPIKDIILAVQTRFALWPSVQINMLQSHQWPSFTVPRHAVEQALIALIKNGVEASPPDSPVILDVDPGPHNVRFIVTDRGRGMGTETLRHVAEPFFTTKGAGRGMGLGTFLVRTLAERLGGSLHFSSSPETGTTATLVLPVHAGAKELARSLS